MVRTLSPISIVIEFELMKECYQVLEVPLSAAPGGMPNISLSRGRICHQPAMKDPDVARTSENCYLNTINITAV